MSTAEYRETAPPISRLGTGADTGPGAFFRYRSIRGAAACWPRPCREPDRAVQDPVHNRVRVYPAAEPRVPVLLLELGAEDGRGRAAPQLNQLQQHRPELSVRLVQKPLVDHEQAERAVLADELALDTRSD